MRKVITGRPPGARSISLRCLRLEALAASRRTISRRCSWIRPRLSSAASVTNGRPREAADAGGDQPDRPHDRRDRQQPPQRLAPVLAPRLDRALLRAPPPGPARRRPRRGTRATRPSSGATRSPSVRAAWVAALRVSSSSPVEPAVGVRLGQAPAGPRRGRRPRRASRPAPAPAGPGSGRPTPGRGRSSSGPGSLRSRSCSRVAITTRPRSRTPRRASTRDPRRCVRSGAPVENAPAAVLDQRRGDRHRRADHRSRPDRSLRRLLRRVPRAAGRRSSTACPSSVAR